MKRMTFVRGISLGMGVGMAVGMATRRGHRNSIRKSKVGKTLRAVTEVMEELSDAMGLT